AHSLPSMPFQLGSIGIILNQTEASGFSLIEYITIPNKHESEIGAGFLRRLLNQAGISKDEWLSV
ncbi:MAG: hypothetical protein NUV76_10730, partial [Candidatus Kuenenia sp.]|nr:hypothetical protein [Candidatus Kuenenia sp.]